MIPSSALLAQAFVSCAMAGVIWIVQVVHYPLMAAVGRERFSDFERSHCERISFVVLPLMLAEAGLASWCVVAASAAQRPLAWAGLLLIGAIWASTFLVQVPCHRVLEGGFDASAHRRLVRSNWLRTVGWSARAGVAIAMLR